MIGQLPFSPPARVVLPAAPQPRARREFPILATVAPVVAALVMWAVSGSPFALVFAFLGPVVALASLIDDKRGGRKAARVDQLRFENELRTAQAVIEKEHARERDALTRLVTVPSEILDGPARSSEWWRDTADSPILVCLGRGTVASSLEVDGPAPAVSSGGPADAYTRLRQAAKNLGDAPVLVDARTGIAVLGPRVPSEALARAIVAQLVFRLSPATVSVTAADSGPFGWLSELPHRRETSAAPADRVVFRDEGAEGRLPVEIVCVVVREDGELPRDCRTVIRVDGSGSTGRLRTSSGVRIDEVRPLFSSEAQAMAITSKARASAEAEGLLPAGSTLPGLVRLAELEPATMERGLPGVFAVGQQGALAIDLVSDGPHAIIGGTTGSGKSELLISWVLAMASAVGPRQLNFLLVDFKGGSSFGSVHRLPHSVGLITDLDQDSASRALASLRAELRHRERTLALAGVRSIDEIEQSATLPRLVIVVDEFAVVVAEFPELQALFADIAARGRSLGVHLILCTQRPSGVVRDSVLANCTLRLSLRVNNRADSVAVIGIGDAGSLPRHPFGRCYLSISGSTPEQVQIALADDDDVTAVVQRWAAESAPVRKPWCEPLPELVPLSMLPEADPSTAGLPFGLIDLPEEQRQPSAVYEPERHGNLLVVGGHGSGKSGVLAAFHETALAQGSHRTVVVPNDVEAAWDLITDAVSRLSESSAEPTLYLLDDLDALLGRFSDDHQLAFSGQLARLLREGPASGIRSVMTVARLSSATQTLATLCDCRLILRLPNRQEHLLAGGDAQGFFPTLPPGGGLWQGHRVQVAFSPTLRDQAPARPVFELTAGSGCVVVTVQPRAFVDRLRAERPEWGMITEVSAQPPSDQLHLGAGETTPILVADPGVWQSQWALLSATRGKLPTLFVGCSISEFRAITGSRQLPPPLGTQSGGAWLLGVDGRVARVQLPTWLCGV